MVMWKFSFARATSQNLRASRSAHGSARQTNKTFYDTTGCHKTTCLSIYTTNSVHWRKKLLREIVISLKSCWMGIASGFQKRYPRQYGVIGKIKLRNRWYGAVSRGMVYEEY
jgi:hypothetical protein